RRGAQPGGGDATARPLRRPPVRPDGEGVADGEPGKRQDHGEDAAQPADSRTPDGTEPAGVRAAHRPAADGRGTEAQAPPAAPHPPPQGGDAGRGTVDPHAEDPALDEEAGADLVADGRTGAPDRALLARPGPP